MSPSPRRPDGARGGGPPLSGPGAGPIPAPDWNGEHIWPWELPGYWPEPAEAHDRGLVASSTSVERAFGGSATVLGAVVPVVLGTRKVTGLEGLTFLYLGVPPTLYLAVWLCHEECAAIVGWTINGYAPASFGPLVSSATHLGAVAQAADLLLSGGITGHVEAWPGICYIALQLDTTNDSMPPSVQIVAEVQGVALIQPIGGGVGRYSANPIEQVCHILTAGEPWLDSFAWANIDAVSAAACVSWCDAVMTDATARFASHVVVVERDPWVTIASILAGCRCHVTEYRNKLYFWHEGSVADSGVTITADDWVHPPSWRPIPVRTRASALRVRFWLDDGFSQGHVDVGDDVSSSRRVEVNLAGCTNISQARRWGEMELARAEACNGYWEGRCDRAVADLLPGDRLQMVPAPKLSKVSVRLRRIVDHRDGTYTVRLEPYVDLDDEAEMTDEETTPPPRQEEPA